MPAVSTVSGLGEPGCSPVVTFFFGSASMHDAHAFLRRGTYIALGGRICCGGCSSADLIQSGGVECTLPAVCCRFRMYHDQPFPQSALLTMMEGFCFSHRLLSSVISAKVESVEDFVEGPCRATRNLYQTVWQKRKQRFVEKKKLYTRFALMSPYTGHSRWPRCSARPP